MFMHINRSLLACLIVCLAAAPAGARAMGGDRRACHSPAHRRSSDDAAATADRTSAAAAGGAISAVDDGQSRHGAAARRHRAQLPADELDATGERGRKAAECIRDSPPTCAALSARMRCCRRRNCRRLSPADQQQIVAARQAVALREALAQEALANSSARFASIQSLIAAISTAGDQKAILDLQTRISAELGMLQNEQTKLQVLAQVSRCAGLGERAAGAGAGHRRTGSVRDPLSTYAVAVARGRTWDFLPHSGSGSTVS